MDNRSKLFANFGPHLTEAISLELLDQINTLRTANHLATINKTTFIENTIRTAKQLPPYAWQSELPDFPP